MTIIEEATAEAVETWEADGVDMLSAFLGSYRAKVRAWLDKHANDRLFKFLPFVRVKHVRWLVEQFLD